MKEHNLYLHKADGKCYVIMVPRNEVEFLLHYLNCKFPAVVIGYSEEIAKKYKANPGSIQN